MTLDGKTVAEAVKAQGFDTSTATVVPVVEQPGQVALFGERKV